MKRILKIASALLLTFSFGLSVVYAQAPEKMSYQAVIRDAGNNLIANQTVEMQISILQGSATGTEVYVETQSPTTNANGLVSIEIGTGTVVSGNFTAIDWANDTYFIKTETDPTGGTNYTITGTSQLLSVPYALHAKTAESLTGTVNYTETDPVFGASIANGITAADTANWNNHTVDTDTHIDSTGIAGLGYVAGAHTVDTDTHIDSAGIAGLGYVAGAHVDSTAIANMGFVAGGGSGGYSVGDFAQGGIVFWVDETGKHGLVCAKSDQNGESSVRWYAGTYGNTQAKGDGPYAGKANTAIIIAAQVAIGDDGNTYAARICNELQITEGGKTYGDWYLPSIAELTLMYQNRATINATATTNGGANFVNNMLYWSSTDINNNNAWGFNFYYGTPDNIGFKDNPYRVRAVRAF
ncbi:MAG: DUF1566 domain-containing protein [Bacteroidales bacterium]|nr:DUF1566 domain-containing protein [Bacteroidales bacterium]